MNDIEIGDVVYLKNDMARAVPMVVCSLEFENVSLQWFGRDMQIISRSFPLGVLCTGLPAEAKRVFEKFELLYSLGIYALYQYESLIAQNFTGQATDYSKDTRLVYEFKKNNAKASFFEERIRLVAFLMDCDMIAAVPAHLPALNNLQRLFGACIRRTKEVAPRKYAHHTDIDEAYENSVEFDLSLLVGKKILLVDDVCSTGKTLVFFKHALEELGFEVLPLACGISHKLKAERSQWVTL